MPNSIFACSTNSPTVPFLYIPKLDVKDTCTSENLTFLEINGIF